MNELDVCRIHGVDGVHVDIALHRHWERRVGRASSCKEGRLEMQNSPATFSQVVGGWKSSS